MKKLLILLLPLCAYMQSLAQGTTQSKFAIYYQNMVGTDTTHLDFSNMKNADAWAPGHNYYAHKDVSQVEYIIRRMKKELNDPDALVIATGGLGRVIADETDVIDLYDPDLAGKGMAIIYRRNREKTQGNGTD